MLLYLLFQEDFVFKVSMHELPGLTGILYLVL